MKTYRNIGFIVVALMWLICLWLLASRQGSQFSVTPAQLSPKAFEPVWMSVYLKGKKAGYSFTAIKPEGDGYLMTQQLDISFKAMGEVKRIRTNLSALLDQSLTLKSFEASLDSDIDFAISGVVRGSDILINLPDGTELPIHSPAPTLEGALLASLSPESLSAGRSIKASTFDPSSLGIRDMEVSVAGKEKLQSMGKLTDAYRLEIMAGGMAFTAWVDEEGRLLREESSFGFSLVRDTEEAAKSNAGAEMDIITESRIELAMPMPEQPKYLKVRVSNIDMAGLELDGGRQTLEGNVLTINRDYLTDAKQSAPGLEEYLSPEPSIQSGHPAIIALAKDIAPSSLDPVRRALRINDWVYANVEKTPVISLPSAIDVLRIKKGDCNEHTVLYIAMARAAGLPARGAYGLAYVEGAFYYHAWVEVFINGKWVSVDPTLGQFPADATHIRLVTGDLSRQSAILGVIGKIKLEGIEAR